MMAITMVQSKSLRGFP